jgi:hypothetical protein
MKAACGECRSPDSIRAIRNVLGLRTVSAADIRRHPRAMATSDPREAWEVLAAQALRHDRYCGNSG